jgi:hypothetical protein
MGTKTIVIEGTLMWAKVFEQNRDMKGFEDAFVPFEGAYTLDVVLDKENFEKLAELGAAKASKIKQKEVEKFGEVTLKFTRKHKDRFEWSSGAPRVFKEDGSEWDLEVDGVIPNNSKGRVTVDVYTTSKATGTRLVAVSVTERAALDEPKPEPEKKTDEVEDALF